MGTPRIYVETSVISYLAARPSRDALTSMRQIATHLWRQGRGRLFVATISDLVLEEIRRGDASAAQRRELLCDELEVIEEPAETVALAQRMMD